MNYFNYLKGELPVIGVYYIFNIALVSLSLASTICVLNFHYRGHRKTKVPRWLKFLLIMKMNNNLNVIENDTSDTKFSLVNSHKSKSSKNLNLNLFTSSENASKSTRLKELHTIRESNSNANLKQTTNRALIFKSKDENLRKMCNLLKSCVKLMENDRALLKADDKIFIEWKEVARRLDIVLFCLSVAIVKVTPLYLFGKYFFIYKDFRSNSVCGCIY